MDSSSSTLRRRATQKIAFPSADATAAGDAFDLEPTKLERVEMRKAIKTPSEWLKFLCRDWVASSEINLDIVEGTDAKLLEYKPYLKGQLTSQQLCRLSIPMNGDHTGTQSDPVDLWGMLGVEDAFDKRYIVAQIERFCTVYNIRGSLIQDELLDQVAFRNAPTNPTTASLVATAGISVEGDSGLSSYLTNVDPTTAATAAAAAAAAAVGFAGATADMEGGRTDTGVSGRSRSRSTKAGVSRQQRRARKSQQRQERERLLEEQKRAALNRCAELINSASVPIEITRGVGARPKEGPHLPKRQKSAITVSTAADLNEIVTLAKTLWTKYNAVAKEHNRKVNWTTVARELGIHVKVREKYARMHARATQRGFDWVSCGHYKVRDYPHIFLEPTENEGKKIANPTSLVTEGQDTNSAAAAAAAHGMVIDNGAGEAPVDAATAAAALHLGVGTVEKM